MVPSVSFIILCIYLSIHAMRVDLLNCRYLINFYFIQMKIKLKRELYL